MEISYNLKSITEFGSYYIKMARFPQTPYQDVYFKNIEISGEGIEQIP